MLSATTGWVAGAGVGAAGARAKGAGHTPPQGDVLLGARILVVEDEFVVAALIEDRLQAFGCEVIGPAADIEAALDLARSAAPDAAILDVNIAGRLVFPVADALAEDGVPFLFATAYGPAGIAPQHAGRTVLGKPYSDAALEQSLRALLSAR